MTFVQPYDKMGTNIDRIYIFIYIYMVKLYNKVQEQVSLWSKGDEAYTWVNLMAISNRANYFTLNEGRGGLSKSHISSKLLDT